MLRCNVQFIFLYLILEQKQLLSNWFSSHSQTSFFVRNKCYWYYTWNAIGYSKFSSFIHEPSYHENDEYKHIKISETKKKKIINRYQGRELSAGKKFYEWNPPNGKSMSNPGKGLMASGHNMLRGNILFSYNWHIVIKFAYFVIVYILNTKTIFSYILWNILRLFNCRTFQFVVLSTRYKLYIR